MVLEECTVGSHSPTGEGPNPSNAPITIVCRLREIREELGVRAVDLARKAGVFQEQICMYEREKRRIRPRIDIALRIATALGVRVDEIWSVPDAPGPTLPADVLSGPVV